MRARLALFAILAPLVLVAAAQACKCKPPPPPKEALEGSAAVFSGKVLKIEKGTEEYELAVTLSVDRQWKGIEGKEVVIYTAKDGATCGYGFEKGKAYLVYANKAMRDKDKATYLSTGLCTRTRSLDLAAEDLKDLGEGKPAK